MCIYIYMYIYIYIYVRKGNKQTASHRFRLNAPFCDDNQRQLGGLSVPGSTEARGTTALTRAGWPPGVWPSPAWPAILRKRCSMREQTFAI